MIPEVNNNHNLLKEDLGKLKALISAKKAELVPAIAIYSDKCQVI